MLFLLPFLLFLDIIFVLEVVSILRFIHIFPIDLTVKSMQRNEANVGSARNLELTQLVVDFQKRLRESSNSVQEAEEHARKLSMEVGSVAYDLFV